VSHTTHSDAAFLEAEIRQDILCGRCEAGKLLLWVFASPALSEKIAWTSDHDPQDGRACRYQIRCDYFRTAVAHPDKLVSCGGFRERHGQ
jgi:hypothetical protein